MATKLIAAKANVNAANSWELTPLHLSARNGHAAIVALMLHANASPNAVDTGGDTPAQRRERNGTTTLQSGCGSGSRALLPSECG